MNVIGRIGILLLSTVFLSGCLSDAAPESFSLLPSSNQIFLSLDNPSTSPNNIWDSPTFKILNTKEGGNVKLHAASDCSDASVASTISSAGYTLISDSNGFSSNETRTYYAQYINQLAEVSNCVGPVSYTYDITPPVFESWTYTISPIITFGAGKAGNISTPTFLLDVNEPIGLMKVYQGAGCAGTLLQTYTVSGDVVTVAGADQTSNAMVSVIYSFSYTDMAGNITCSNTDGYYFDNVGPLITVDPSENSNSPAAAVISGSCETAGGMVSLSGSDLSTSVTTPCTSGTYSSAVLFLASGNKSVMVSQADAVGNLSSVTRHLNIYKPASNLVVAVPASAIAGNVFTVTVSIKDADGNTVTMGPDATASVSLAKNSGTGSLIGVVPVNAVNGVATFNTGFIQLVDIYNLTATKAATAGLGSTGIINNNSSNFNITHAPISYSNSLVSSVATVKSGEVTPITVELKDQYNNPVITGTYSVVATPAAASASSGTFGAVTNNGNGSYFVSFTGIVSGDILPIKVTVNGINIVDQTSLTVVPGDISAAKSIITVANTSIPSGTNTTVTLQGRDINNNILVASSDTVVFSYTGGTSTGTMSPTTNNGNGTFSATFTGNVVGTATTIIAMINGINVTTTLPTVTVTPALVPYTWTGAVSTDWYNNSNWVTARPGAGQVAIFDNSCSTNCSPTNIAGVTVDGIDIKSTYTGTLNFTSATNNSVNIGSSGISVKGGTLILGDMNDAVYIAGPLIVDGAAATLNMSGALVNLSSDLNVINGGNFIQGTSTVNIVGGANRQMMGISNLNHLNVNMSATGQLNLNNQMISILGDMSLVCPAGSSRPSMQINNGTFLISHNLSDYSTSGQCGNLSAASADFIINSALNSDSLSGTGILGVGYLFDNITINGVANFNIKNYISLRGDFIVNNSFIDVWNNSTITIEGNTTTTIDFPVTKKINNLNLQKITGAMVIVSKELMVGGNLLIDQFGSLINNQNILLFGNLELYNNSGGSSNIELIGLSNQYLFQASAGARFPGATLTISNSPNTTFLDSNLYLDNGSQSLILNNNSHFEANATNLTLNISDHLTLESGSRFVERCAAVNIRGIDSLPDMASINNLSLSGAIVNNGGEYFDGVEGLIVSVPNYTVSENTGGTPLTVDMIGDINCEAISFMLVPSVMAGGPSPTIAKTPDDFSLIPLNGTIFANSTSSTSNNYIPVNDTMYESGELHHMTFTSYYRGLGGSDYIGDLTILNDDAIPTIQFGTASSSFAEGNSGSIAVNVPVSISHASSVPLTVTYNIDALSNATSGTDYTLISGTTLTFPAESMSAQNINVSILGDVVDDDNEFVKFNLFPFGTPAPNIGAISQHTLNITDDDLAPPAIINVNTSASVNTVFSDGAPVYIELIYNQNVTVNTTGGVPSLKLNTTPVRYANYVSGSSNVLTFRYDVLPNDLAPAPMAYFDVNSLLLNGGTIRDTSTGFINANNTLPVFNNTVTLYTKNIRINPRPVISKNTCMTEGYQSENYAGCSVSAINISDVGDSGTPIYEIFPGGVVAGDCNWMSIGNMNTATGILNSSIMNVVGRCKLRFRVYDGTHYSTESVVNLNVLPNMGFSSVDVAGFHGCAIVDGRPKCWGRQEANSMALGDSSVAVNTYYNYVLPVNVLNGHYIDGFTRIKTSGNSALSSFTCARTATAQLQCWGRNARRELGNGVIETFRGVVNSYVKDTSFVDITGVVSFDLGAEFGCAVIQTNDPATTGKVMCWGAGTDFQLGNGIASDSQYAMTANIALNTPLLGAVQVVTGEKHACALLGDGTVKCWGNNGGGQLGRDNTTNQAYAVDVLGFSNKKVIQLAAGDYTTCALLSDGKIQCWGIGTFGVRGSDDTNNVGTGIHLMSNLTPINFQNTDPAIEISMGAYTACAIFKPTSGDNYARCWGYNGGGQLGKGDTIDVGNGSPLMNTISAIDLGAGLYPKSISVGVMSVCAIVADTTSIKGVKCWGKNDAAQLGDGSSMMDKGDGPNEMGTFLKFSPLNPQIYVSEITMQGNKVLDTDPVTGGIGSCQKVALDNNHPAGKQARVLVSQKSPSFAPFYPWHMNTGKNWKSFPVSATYDMRDVYSSTVPMVKRSGAIYVNVANNWNALFAPMITLSSIVDTRFMGIPLSTNPWTGSRADYNVMDNGTWKDSTCSNWTSNGLVGIDNTGAAGDTSSLDDFWINYTETSCNNFQRVFCVLP